MKQYLDLCSHILNNGVEKTDRTGTGTLSVFGHQMRFNLAEGFPLVTTKKIHTKSVIHELLWFLSGDTNIKYLQDNGVRIWNEWRRPYTIDREIVFIEPKKSEYFKYEGNFSCDGLNTKKDSIERKLSEIWVRMMRRCYDKKHHRYELYGAKGCSVHEEWHNPANFIRDAQKLPHWWYKNKNWNSFELDKDYFGANQYGPETSVWLSTEENNFYTKTAKPIEVVDENGLVKFFLTLNDAARKNGIPASTLSRFMNNGTPKILKGNNKKYIGWEFREAEFDGKLPRLALIDSLDLGSVYGKQWRNFNGIDQISWVINEIKNNPDSRRLIVSAWNVGELKDMALEPCHTMFQFYVTNGKLSCQLYQRSGDVFLGIPFNIASYALLTMMIAQVTGLELGDFVHTIGDAHIYTNHIEQVKLQLTREPKPLPQMILNKEVTDIFDFKYDDFTLVNYDSWPHIPGKVAI